VPYLPVNGKRHRRKVDRRNGWKRYRASEKQALRGDRPRGHYFAEGWSNHKVLKQNTLPML
jgi:hypothetical protein